MKETKKKQKKLRDIIRIDVQQLSIVVCCCPWAFFVVVVVWTGRRSVEFMNIPYADLLLLSWRCRGDGTHGYFVLRIVLTQSSSVWASRTATNRIQYVQVYFVCIYVFKNARSVHVNYIHTQLDWRERGWKNTRNLLLYHVKTPFYYRIERKT